MDAYKGAFGAISGALYTRPTYAYTGDYISAMSGDATASAYIGAYCATTTTHT